jgi:hypothetical protein
MKYNKEIINFDKNKYNFKKMVQNVFEVEDLEKIHEDYSYHSGLCTMQDNSNSIYHKRFYDKLRSGWSEFTDLYEGLIKNVIFPRYESGCVFQTTPTLRIHLVKNWATPEFHCDSQPGYNHPVGEKNYLLPLTECYGNNSLWVETEPNKGDYHPMRLNYGQVIEWDGNVLRHGNKINDTEKTRVSLDFRVLPKKYYKPKKNEQPSGTRKMRFIVGEYYKEL